MTPATQPLRNALAALFGAAHPAIVTSAAHAADQPATRPVDPMVDMAQAASLGVTLLKVFGALLITIALLYLLVFLFRKLGMARISRGATPLITVLDSRMIAPKKFIAVVKVAEQTLALGVTDQQITMLSRLDDAAAPPQQQAEGQASFSSLLDEAREPKQP